jgi:hypothetical protein
MLVEPASDHDVAVRLRDGVLTLGDAFSFMSGLYFRGKITYARTFGRAPNETFIITPTRGLIRPDVLVTRDLLREFGTVEIDTGDARYLGPLERDLATLVARLPADARVVLLGSVATGKYVDVLAARLGPRLYFPPSFIGRGDMSRGGLLLRHAASGTELDYAVLEPAARRHGPRPPKLAPR